uniref:Uncharacterized protein n=1 Tax=Dulem virus 36 TaxID=3145754 RepID=A0AAU8B0W3_9CAUD
MKELLELDCTKEINKQKLNKALYEIKPIKKHCNIGIVPIEILEKVMHGLCMKYGYNAQYITIAYCNERFMYYTASVCRGTGAHRKWLGNVYGKSMWELLAKILIKMYIEIKQERG